MKINARQVLCLLLSLVLATPAAANDPFLDLINNRQFDKSELLREFKNVSVTVQASDDSAVNSSNTAPGFLQPTLPENTNLDALANADVLALILPTQAAGLRQQVATRFQEGCIQGLKATNSIAQVNLYATDGSPELTLAAYERAIKEDARFIIGPMQKSNTQALLTAVPDAPLPTLLLQPLADDSSAQHKNYYSLSLDIGAEIASLVQFIYPYHPRILLVGDNSPTSRRQVQAFTRAWGQTTPRPLEHFYVYDTANDWQRLFNQLREEIDDDDETEEGDENDTGETKPAAPPPPDEEAEPLPVVFAAGNNAFVQQVRQFTPQSFVVYASSIFYASANNNAAFLSNLRIMEMPWWFDVPQWEEFETPLIRSRPPLEQRFYALGLDACRISQQLAFWHGGWQFDGASGQLRLGSRNFARQGILAQYHLGGLKVVQKL